MNIEFFIDQLLSFWQFVVVAIAIIVGFVVNKIDGGENKPRVNFKYKEMPHMKPLPIETASKGFWGAVWLWLMGVRQWEITKDWYFEIDGTEYVIEKGFQFDGASVPKFLASWLSPTGVLLMGGLVHDYAYKYARLDLKTSNDSWLMDQKKADQLFRDICIEVNGFKVLNYLAWAALRLGGFVAWNGHRKNDKGE